MFGFVNFEQLITDKSVLNDLSLKKDIKVFKGERLYFRIATDEVSLTGLRYVGDLTVQNGVNIYSEYFVNINKSTTPFVPKASYPDILIPYDSDKALELCKNIGIKTFSIRINTFDMKKSIYNFVFEFNEKKINLTIFILDLKLPIEIKQKSLFGVFTDEIEGKEIKAKYNEIKNINKLLSEFCISSSYPAVPIEYTDEEYINEVKNTYYNNNISTFCLRGDSKYNNSYFDDYFMDVKRKIKIIARISKEDSKNYFKKCVAYFPIIDEPSPEKYSIVGLVCGRFAQIKNDVAENYKNYDYIYNGIFNLKNVITVYYHKELEGITEIWCPGYSTFDTQEMYMPSKERQQKGDGLWWYGCVWPSHPFPNYHLDEAPANSRIIGLLQSEYEVEGNLYWCVNLSSHYNWNEKKYEPVNLLQNPMLFDPVNGDGFLIYKGKLLGMKGYLPSLRLLRIECGVNDYQISEELKVEFNILSKKYSVKISYKEYLRELLSELVIGMKVKDSINDFEKVIALYRIYLYCAKKYNVLFIRNGNLIKVYKPCDCEIKVNGKTILDYFYVVKNTNIIVDNSYSFNFEYKKIVDIIDDKIVIDKQKLPLTRKIIYNISLSQISEIRIKLDNRLKNEVCIKISLLDVNNKSIYLGYNVSSNNYAVINPNPYYSLEYNNFDSTFLVQHFEEKKNKIDLINTNQISGFLFEIFSSNLLNAQYTSSNENNEKLIIENIEMVLK